jgi:hypothetical protein
MNAVEIADLKAHLSEHLRTVRAGQVMTIDDRNVPVAPGLDILAELAVERDRDRRR